MVGAWAFFLSLGLSAGVSIFLCSFHFLFALVARDFAGEEMWNICHSASCICVLFVVGWVMPKQCHWPLGAFAKP